MATQLQERSGGSDPVTVVRQNLNQMADQFKMALPAHISVDKFQRVVMTAIQTSPALVNADRRSLFGSVVKAAQDGLLPDGREGALVIYNGKAGAQVQWMPMIAGILKKIRNSGEVAWIDCHVVYSNDKFTYRPGIDVVPIFEPDWFGDRGTMIGVYAIAAAKDGTIFPPEIMSLEQIEKVRKVSRASGNGPWGQWPEEMARKSCLRRFAKRLPSSTDIEAAFERDDTMAAASSAAIMSLPEAAPRIPESRLDALEQSIGGVLHDSDTGEVIEGVTTVVALEDAKAEISAAELVPDVNSRLAQLEPLLSAEDAEELRLHAMDRLAELRSKK